MRSKIAAKILNETPQAVKDFVKNYANNMRNKDVYEVIEQAEREIQSLHEQLNQLETQSHDQVKIIEHLEQQLKQERNKAIQQCINSANNISDRATLIKKLESLKTLTAHGEY